MFVTTRKCPIELGYNFKMFDRTTFQLDSLVTTNMIFS